MGFKIKFKIKSRAASSGNGGGEATPPPPLPQLPVVPPPSPSRDPTVLSISPSTLPLLRPPPPPPRADEDTDKVPDVEDWGDEEDDEDSGEVEDDEDWEEKKRKTPPEIRYRCLFMSRQKDIPHYIVRYDAVPLDKNEYFSLQKNWNQLLDGKRTYLRPPREHRVLKDVFRCPDARPRTLGRHEPLLALILESSNNYVILQKIKILSQRYMLFRRTRRDGSCFYRAFFFSYLENLGQMQDSQAEVTRLMKCVSRSRENFRRLKWDKAYFLNPEAYFSSVVSEFNHMVNSVANGLSSDELYERSLREIMSFRKIEIRTREEDYRSAMPQQMSTLECCLKAVRPMDVEAISLQIRALSYALGIPLRVEVVDKSLSAGAVKVKRYDFFPRSESGKGPLHLVESYSSSSTINSNKQPGASTCGNLLSSDGTPLLTLLSRRGCCDILYRK